MQCLYAIQSRIIQANLTDALLLLLVLTISHNRSKFLQRQLQNHVLFPRIGLLPSPSYGGPPLRPSFPIPIFMGGVPPYLLGPP